MNRKLEMIRGVSIKASHAWAEYFFDFPFPGTLLQPMALFHNLFIYLYDTI